MKSLTKAQIWKYPKSGFNKMKIQPPTVEK